MNKKLLPLVLGSASILFFWPMTPSVSAQNNSVAAAVPRPDTDVLGAKALHARVGNPAAWEIRVSDQGSGAKTPGGKAPALQSKSGSPILQKVNIARNGKVTRVVCDFSDNRHEVTWIIGSKQVQMASPEASVLEVPAAYGGTRNFGSSDFPELGWILNKHPVAQQVLNGQVCRVFSADAETVSRFETELLREMVENSQASTISANPRTAYIGVDSGLPVRIIDGTVIYDYIYLPPPSDIPVPQKIENTLNNFQRKFDAAFPRMLGQQ